MINKYQFIYKAIFIGWWNSKAVFLKLSKNLCMMIVKNRQEIYMEWKKEKKSQKEEKN